MAALKLVVISGLSGSGKSHALKCFEDVGYFCIDNLPPALLPPFVELCHQQGGAIKNIALGIDVRERVFFSDLVGILERVKVLGHAVELVFFEAREEVLVRRFSESRRPHPLLPHLPVLEGVRFEKERLADLRRHASALESRAGGSRIARARLSACPPIAHEAHRSPDRASRDPGRPRPTDRDRAPDHRRREAFARVLSRPARRAILPRGPH